MALYGHRKAEQSRLEEVVHSNVALSQPATSVVNRKPEYGDLQKDDIDVENHPEGAVNDEPGRMPPNRASHHSIINGEETSIDGYHESKTRTEGGPGIDERDLEEIRTWLKQELNMERYYHNFVLNGYEKMSFVEAISDYEDLTEIGIQSKDQSTILLAIRNRTDRTDAK